MLKNMLLMLLISIHLCHCKEHFSNGTLKNCPRTPSIPWNTVRTPGSNLLLASLQ